MEMFEKGGQIEEMCGIYILLPRLSAVSHKTSMQTSVKNQLSSPTPGHFTGTFQVVASSYSSTSN